MRCAGACRLWFSWPVCCASRARPLVTATAGCGRGSRPRERDALSCTRALGRGSGRGRRPDARARPQVSARSGGSRRTVRRRARAASGGRTTCRSWRRRCVPAAAITLTLPLPPEIHEAPAAPPSSLRCSGAWCAPGAWWGLRTTGASDAVQRGRAESSLVCLAVGRQAHTRPGTPGAWSASETRAQPHSSATGVRSPKGETSNAHQALDQFCSPAAQVYALRRKVAAASAATAAVAAPDEAEPREAGAARHEAAAAPYPGELERGEAVKAQARGDGAERPPDLKAEALGAGARGDGGGGEAAPAEAAAPRGALLSVSAVALTDRNVLQADTLRTACLPLTRCAQQF